MLDIRKHEQECLRKGNQTLIVWGVKNSSEQQYLWQTFLYYSWAKWFMRKCFGLVWRCWTYLIAFVKKLNLQIKMQEHYQTCHTAHVSSIYILVYCTVVQLRIFNVHEILFGWCCSSVPGTRVIIPLDTGKEFGLLSIDSILHHPVHPQALRWATDNAGDGGAASDLRTRQTNKIHK